MSPSDAAATTDRRTRLALVATAVGCLVLFVVLYWLAVHTAVGQRLDETAVKNHRYDRTPPRDLHLYDQGSILAMAALGAVVVAFAVPRWKLLMVLAGSIGTAVVGANVLRRVLLDRPNLGVFDMLYGPSFPSGHATAAVTIAAALFVVCPWPRWVRRVVAVLVAASIDGLVLFIPIHRPSDVIAGNLLGLGVLCVALALFGPDLRSVGQNATRGQWWRVPIGYAALGAVTAAALLGLMSRLAHRSDLSLRSYGLGFAVGLLVDVLSAAAVLAAFELLLSRPAPLRAPGSAGGP